MQDALDEIEYVTGGTDTKWGAERAKNGHPAPFKLTYVEIGNEDQFDRSGSYEGRYAQFYKAIKAKYPDLQLIATAPREEHEAGRARRTLLCPRHAELRRRHYDPRRTRTQNGQRHYDKRPQRPQDLRRRMGHARRDLPLPTWARLSGDAAWMTGLERNSDLIVMACYAPLFVNVNPGGMQWETDLIGYNTIELRLAWLLRAGPVRFLPRRSHHCFQHRQCRRKALLLRDN